MTENPQFTRKIEDFVCAKCGTHVRGNGYTNHCSSCLWSKHVDINPGDRAAQCDGLMEPISVESRAGEVVLLHKCVRCGFLRKNRVGKSDNFEAVLHISKSG